MRQKRPKPNALTVASVEKPAGRVVETTLYDILKQDPQHYSFKLYFQIDRIEGDTAYTILKGHEFSREYLRSLIRRGSSMSDFIKDYKTKDGYMSVNARRDPHFQRLAKLIGKDEWLEDPRYADARSRVKHRDELMADWQLAVSGQQPFRIDPLR